MKKEEGLQTDLFGNNVHIVNVNDVKTYRMVKCGECGNTVKMSKAKTHLSFGKTLTICEDCLKRSGKFIGKKEIKK